MQKLVQDVTDQEISEMLDKHDKSRDGTLNFDEFKVIFKENQSTIEDIFPRSKTFKSRRRPLDTRKGLSELNV